MRSAFSWWLALTGVGLSGCADRPPALLATPVAEAERALDPPAGPGALAARLGGEGGELWLSWLEPGEDGGHRLRWSRLGADGWGPAADIVAIPSAFANWADRPAVARNRTGRFVAHWLERNGVETYAYGVALATRSEAGEWTRAGSLHADASAAEHGFVAWAPEAGGLRAIWLDGGAAARGEAGAMELRTARVEDATVVAEEVLDSRVCDCCSTDLVATAQGTLAVYRGRTDTEVRDILAVSRRDGVWGAPARVAADEWEVAGCPVNEPAVAAEGDRVAVAWFTAPTGRSRVAVAFSGDGGASFSAPVVVDEADPLGRVDLVLDPGGPGAVVVWLARDGEGAEIRLARVEPAGVREVRRVAPSSGQRAAGVPELGRRNGELVVVWRDDDDPGRLRGAALAWLE